MKKILSLVLLFLLASSVVNAEIVSNTQAPGGGGGSVSITSGNGGIIVSPSPITGTGSVTLQPSSASVIGGVESTTGVSHQFLTSLSTLGVFSQAQPAFTDISGNIATTQVNSGTSASSTTFFRGDNTWSAPFSLTTTGSSGAATFSAGTLNIPQYSGGGGSPGSPVGSIQANIAGSFGGLSNTTASQTALSGIIGQPPLYVTNYGVLCNGKTLQDVTTTASNAVISSASYTFVAGDVGKIISVWAGTAYTSSTMVTTNGSKFASAGSTSGLKNGMMLVGTNIPQGTYVTGVYTTGSGLAGFSMSNAATNTGSSLSVSAYPVINTTILSVAGGNATLNTTATSSITGKATVVFGTDDTTNLQAADTAAKNAGGGLLVLPLGMCITTASVIVDNNVSITGYGAGKSIIKWIAATDQLTPVLYGINQSNNVTCSPTNALLQSNNRLTNFEIDDLSATDATFHVSAKGIGMFCNYHSVVDSLYVHDTMATGIATDAAINGQVTNNIIENAGRFGGNAQGSNGIGQGAYGMEGEAYIITGNIIVNPNHFGAFIESEVSTAILASTVISNNIVFEGGNSNAANNGVNGSAGIGNSGTTGMTITGNFIYGFNDNNINWYGITQNDGTLPNPSGTQSTITGNYVSGTNGGIILDYINTAPLGNAKTVVSGNNIVNPTGFGVELITSNASTFMTDVIVSGNQVAGAGSACYGIAGTGTAQSIVFTGNIGFSCGNISGTTDYRKSGLAISSNTTKLTVTNNTFYDDGASTQKYGIAVNTSVTNTGAFFANNNIANNTTSPLDMLGTITGVFQGNVGMPAPTISGCTATSPAGNGDIGKYTSGTTGSCAVTITPFGTANIIANNGWLCNAYDSTTTANVQTQTADTTTTATITGTTVSADVVKFNCRMW
jgi:hypothetical protein